MTSNINTFSSYSLSLSVWARDIQNGFDTLHVLVYRNTESRCKCSVGLFVCWKYTRSPPSVEPPMDKNSHFCSKSEISVSWRADPLSLFYHLGLSYRSIHSVAGPKSRSMLYLLEGSGLSIHGNNEPWSFVSVFVPSLNSVSNQHIYACLLPVDSSVLLLGSIYLFGRFRHKEITKIHMAHAHDHPYILPSSENNSFSTSWLQLEYYGYRQIYILQSERLAKRFE